MISAWGQLEARLLWCQHGITCDSHLRVLHGCLYRFWGFATRQSRSFCRVWKANQWPMTITNWAHSNGGLIMLNYSPYKLDGFKARWALGAQWPFTNWTGSKDRPSQQSLLFDCFPNIWRKQAFLEIMTQVNDKTTKRKIWQISNSFLVIVCIFL